MFYKMMVPRRFVVFGLIMLSLAFASLAFAPRTFAIECPPKALPLPGAACCKCEPVVAAPPAVTNDICVTSKTRVAALNDRKVFAIFSDFGANNPNGMLVAEIPFSAVRSVTDAEKAAGQIVWLVSKDSEYAKGWHVAIYWSNGHYGVQVTGGSFSDDTGATCGWF